MHERHPARSSHRPPTRHRTGGLRCGRCAPALPGSRTDAPKAPYPGTRRSTGTVPRHLSPTGEGKHQAQGPSAGFFSLIFLSDGEAPRA